MNQQSQKDRNICIVGGGLAGPMMGIMLAKRGFKVTILERRQDMRKTNISAGRSINLALSVRGFAALEAIGLKEELLKISIPMIGRMIHDIEGTTHLQRYGTDDSQAIYSVSRGLLNCILLDLAEQLGINIIFESNCYKYDLEGNILHCKKKDQENEFQISDSIVIAADGYCSTIREALKQGVELVHSQQNESHGYKELTLPPAADGSFQIERNALHIWPRGGFMLIALPNQDGNFTCTLFLSHSDGDENFEKLKDEASILQFFQKYFHDALKMMPNLIEQFLANPIGSLCTIKVWPWHYKDYAVLIGDAAHSIVPFYGQGMNCAFEDCYVFSQMLDQDVAKNGQVDWASLLNDFACSRKPNTDAIQDLAVQNFVEMRDLVNDPFFKLKKECEIKIAKKHVDFVPKYSLISFSTTPYAVAMKRGQINENVLSQLCANISSSDQFDETAAYVEIMKLYQEIN